MYRRDFLSSIAAAICAPIAFVDLRAEENASSLPKNVTFRGNFDNSKFTFETTGKGRVAFLGGSITEMDGYRPMVCDYLQQKFPETEFEFIAAGIASTCSDVGAFRLESDVLANGPVDLFFVEFAVNDDQDGMFDEEHSIRGMEGIIRHMREDCPNVDIVMTYFVNDNLMHKYREGSIATSIKAHRQVAERYAISTIDLAKEIQEQIDSKKITWEEFGGVHPAPKGNRICADMIASLLNSAWSKSTASKTNPHALPEIIDSNSYYCGGYRGFDDVALNGGFELFIPDWSKIPGGFRERFAGIPCLCADQPGAEASFEFEGNTLALYVLAGPDAGIVETKVDDGEWTQTNAFHDFSGGLHYPRAVTLADALTDGKHKATIRVAEESDERSHGTALRIMQICVNK